MKLAKIIEDFLDQYEGTKVFERAQNIYYENDPELLSLDVKQGTASYSVPSQSGRASYRVQVVNFHKPEKLRVLCSCPYNHSDICKHGFVALFDLENKFENGDYDAFVEDQVEKKPSDRSSGKKSLHFPDPISIQALERIANIDYRLSWQTRNWIYEFQNLRHNKNILSGELNSGRKKYFPQVSMSDDNHLLASCDCDSSKAICEHAFSLILAFTIKNRSHEDALFYLRNHEKTVLEKIKEYGFGPDDDWKKIFDVLVEYPRVEVIPKDRELSKIADFANWSSLTARFIQSVKDIHPEHFHTDKPNYGILWNFSHSDNFIYINLLIGKRKKNGDLGAPLRMIHSHSRNTENLNRDQVDILNLLIRADVMQNLYDEWGLVSTPSMDFESQLDSFQLRHKRILEVFPKLILEEHYLSNEEVIRDTISVRSVSRIFPQSEKPSLKFRFRLEEDQYVLYPFLVIEDEDISITTFELVSYGFILRNDRLYIMDENTARTVYFFIAIGNYKIRKEDLQPFLDQMLFPLMDHFEVIFEDIDLNIEETALIPEKKIYLKEIEQNLIIIPAVVYQLDDEIFREVYLDGGKRINFQDQDFQNIYSIIRDEDSEEKMRNQLENLHPKFPDTGEHFFSLPIHQVMRDNWFFKAFDFFKKEGFEILGLKELKNLKYSPFRPEIKLQAGSGMDWFDLKMEVSFGKQKVRLVDIRKAILNNQSYVNLGDGTMGILPEEWLKKYSSIFKIGKVEKDKLKLSEFQLNVIDELYEEIENHEVFKDFLDKRERLQSFQEIKDIKLPSPLKAKLRNYQKEGYNWLNFLHEFKWGGCLADDMGLGKTVQMLSFLLNVSEINPGVTHLAVVPKSLVFNWINEVEKFCPGYKVLRHTGTDRANDSRKFSQYDLIVTTYGLVRSDIEMFREFKFGYIVLDESQAIKNPTTLTAKAVKLLKADNRLIMTGTPIENNTFDLFSQMDFVNPGMLGSLENFKREFANPIDKDKDELAATQLRKLVYPFILSRKKEEVAKELPEKNETIIYCEMSPSQRKIYDHFKDKYRNMLMDKIETEGYHKAGVHILQGLLKLRQICNSPQLLDENDGQFSKDSTKMETLMEMLEDIFSQGNKVLIFSFFKGMLDLVGQALDRKKIGYVTLTGDSHNRESLVETFKLEKDKKAFLISLKAGGFGLNLAEANYVFLIDPWWNPAVEQQAIDRTHRIGQTQSVFAYKLICKDTIEEKILKIQSNKKALGKEFIHTEAGFLKNLKPEDVKDLFS